MKKVDGNGILYELLPDADVSKFHILSAAEQRRNIEIYDMQQRMLERQQEIKKYYGSKTGVSSGKTKIPNKKKRIHSLKHW